MKISPIFNYRIKSNKNVFIKPNRQFYVKNSIKDTFSFVGNNYVKNNVVDKYSYDKFTKTAKECGINTEKDLISNIKPENLLGVGANSKVYKFDNKKLSDWVLKEDFKPFYKPAKSLFEPTKDDFKEYNFGQEIAKSGNRYRILKKVTGTPHSVSNWSKTINNNSIVSREESLEFLNSLKKIQNFPQSSFDKYAEDLKMLEDRGYKQDSVNPNNILIDYEKQKIQIIDLNPKASKLYINSKHDLINVLLDFSLFSRFYKQLNDEEKKQLVEYSNNIADKCTTASQKAGLRQEESVYLNYLGKVDKYFGWFLLDKGGDYQTRLYQMKTILENEK